MKAVGPLLDDVDGWWSIAPRRRVLTPWRLDISPIDGEAYQSPLLVFDVGDLYEMLDLPRIPDSNVFQYYLVSQ